MSYRSGLNEQQEEIMFQAITFPLFKKGDVIDLKEHGKRRLLEDSAAHGCPRVVNIDTEEEYCMTMNGHGVIYEAICKARGIDPDPEVGKIIDEN